MATSYFKKRQVAPHSQIKSKDWNAMQDELERDLQVIYDELRLLKQDLARAERGLVLSRVLNRSLIERSLEREKQERFLKAVNGDTDLWELVDFRRTGNLLFKHPTDVWTISEANRLRIDPGYGQATLPYDRAVSRFYSLDPDTRKVVPFTEIETEVTVVNEPDPLKVVPGEVKNAFNGQNESAWIREVWYPLHSDVEEVSCDLDVTVPVSVAAASNVLQIHPYPDGLVDVVHVYYETSDVAPTLDITTVGTTSWYGPTFPQNESSWLRGHLRPLAIQRIKIRLRQRNWVERNGFKVFTYGLQELGLLLVDFSSDDTNLSSSNPTADKSVVVRFDAPAGYTFRAVTGVWTEPLPFTDLVLAIYTDQALSTKVWHSGQTLPQSASAIQIGAGVPSLYMAVGMGYHQASDVAPLLERILLQYTVR